MSRARALHFVTAQPAARDARPARQFFAVELRELAALKRSKDPILKAMAKRIESTVADTERESIEKLHESLRRQAALHAHEVNRRAALTPTQRDAEDRDRRQLQNAVHAMMGAH